MATKTAARKTTTGEQAINAAMAAGFEITQHGRTDGRYRHQLSHADGRAITIDTELGTGRLINAKGENRTRWNATRLSARSITTLERLVSTPRKTNEQIKAEYAERAATRRANRAELSEQHAWALEYERRLRNDLRRERRQIFGR